VQTETGLGRKKTSVMLADKKEEARAARTNKFVVNFFTHLFPW